MRSILAYICRQPAHELIVFTLRPLPTFTSVPFKFNPLLELDPVGVVLNMVAVRTWLYGLKITVRSLSCPQFI